METVNDAAEAKAAEIKKKLGEFLDWGHINFESANGVIQSNCKAMMFASADEMNEYFKTHTGTFAAQIFPLNGGLCMIANRKLAEEDQQVLSDFGAEINKKVAELALDRDKAKIAEEEELKKRVADLEALQELGRKCQHNHGAVIDENQKLKKEVKDLRKKVNK